MVWGYLRETTEQAIKAGLDPVTKVHRTGLNEYLKVIFPNTNDWIHDKPFTTPNKSYRIRPDYRSDSLKLIVEFDGLLHYQFPDIILKDYEKTAIYIDEGYKVVRIPYFIQLTNKAVKTLFGVDVKEDLFDENLPSLNVKDRCTPAFLCPLGIKRMSAEFINFPEQYLVNLKALEKINNEALSGISYLDFYIK